MALTPRGGEVRHGVTSRRDSRESHAISITLCLDYLDIARLSIYLDSRDYLERYI